MKRIILNETHWPPCEPRASHSGCGGVEGKAEARQLRPTPSIPFSIYGGDTSYTKQCRKHISAFCRRDGARFWLLCMFSLRICYPTTPNHNTRHATYGARASEGDYRKNFMVAHVTSRGSEYCSCGDTESAGGMTRLWPFLLFASQGHPAESSECYTYLWCPSDTCNRS